jgi:hypothetical protein
VAVADSTEEQLSWEARQRPRAAAAAITAGVLTLGANVWSQVGFNGSPHAGFLESLQNVARPGPVGGAPSVRTAAFQFFDDHAVAAIGTSVVLAIGLVGLGWAAAFLAAAARARRLETPRLAAYLPIAGGVLQAVAAILRSVATASGVSTFLDGPHTVDRAADVSGNSILVTSAFIGFAGQLALAAGLVLICLNAMRAGLLTRFMGVIGLLVGLLQIVPFSVQPIVQAFWLLALGALFLGFWPGPGVPPAWRTGQAEPWPSQAELAEQRRAARGGGAPQRGRQPRPSDGTPAAPQRPAPVAGSAKRKRKRRR